MLKLKLSWEFASKIQHCNESLISCAPCSLSIASIVTMISYPTALAVAGLTKLCTADDLADLFQHFGPIVSAEITHRSMHSAIGTVFLSCLEAAEAAMDSLDGCQFMGKPLRSVCCPSQRLSDSMAHRCPNRSISYANNGSSFRQAITASAPLPAINSVYIRYFARKVSVPSFVPCISC